MENEIEFNNIGDIHLKMETELNKKINFNEVLDKYIDNMMEKREDKYIFRHKTKVIIIYWSSVS